MRFRQLDAFRAAVESGSITRAAEALSVGQPAVSRLIADLEASVGFPLFQRSAGRVTPTAEGLRFYAAVERAFTSLDGLKRAADQIRHAYSDHLTVSALPVLASTVIPGAVERFLKLHPQVTVDIHSLVMDQILDNIRAQQANVAVSVSFTDVPGVRQEPLTEVQFVCALPAGHALARKKRIEMRDFDGQNLISLLPVASIGWSRIEQLFEAHGVHPRRRIATRMSHTAYSLVSAGLGISILDPFGARHWSHHGVVIRPLTQDLSFTYSLFYPVSSGETPLVRDFVSCLRETLAEN